MLRRILQPTRAAWWAVMLLALCAGPVAAQYDQTGLTPGPVRTGVLKEWVEVTDRAEGFTALFPLRPEKKVEKVEMGKGAPVLTRNTYVALHDDGKRRYLVSSVTLPIPPPKNGEAVIAREMYEQLLLKFKKSFEFSIQKVDESCYLDAPRDVFTGPNRGRQYELRGQGCQVAGSVRFFASARRLFVLMVVGDPSAAENFFGSFVMLNSGERLIVQ